MNGNSFLLLLALAFLVATLLFVFSYRPVLLYVGRWVFAWRYKVEVEGMDEATADISTNHRTTQPLVLLGAVRAAPPRDDACRGLDRPRQGMVEAHAA